ncbi:hypothetical protein ACFL56_01380 [Candidatus Margulisiibacteriota bacterium]
MTKLYADFNDGDENEDDEDFYSMMNNPEQFLNSLPDEAHVEDLMKKIEDMDRRAANRTEPTLSPYMKENFIDLTNRLTYDLDATQITVIINEISHYFYKIDFIHLEKAIRDELLFPLLDKLIEILERAPFDAAMLYIVVQLMAEIALLQPIELHDTMWKVLFKRWETITNALLKNYYYLALINTINGLPDFAGTPKGHKKKIREYLSTLFKNKDYLLNFIPLIAPGFIVAHLSSFLSLLHSSGYSVDVRLILLKIILNSLDVRREEDHVLVEEFLLNYLSQKSCSLFDDAQHGVHLPSEIGNLHRPEFFEDVYEKYIHSEDLVVKRRYLKLLNILQFHFNSPAYDSYIKRLKKDFINYLLQIIAAKKGTAPQTALFNLLYEFLDFNFVKEEIGMDEGMQEIISTFYSKFNTSKNAKTVYEPILKKCKQVMN